MPNVEVVGFDGITADFAMQRGASVIVRGLRTTDSLANELTMAGANRAMNRTIQTLFVPASEERDHISSTVVREIAANGGDASNTRTGFDSWSVT